MADLFGREEEEDLFGSSGGDPFAGMSTDPFAGVSGDPFGPYKKNDPLATSWDNFKIQFGGSLQTVDEILGTSTFLSDWGNHLEKSGELGKEDYQPKYDTSFLEAEGWDKVGWALEKASENAASMGATVAASVAAAVAGLGVGATVATAGLFRGLLNLDDVGRTHVKNAGKEVKDFDAGEKANLLFATALNTALDSIAPGKIAKGFTPGSKIDVKEQLTKWASKLNNYEKTQFANAFFTGLKKSTAIGLYEAGTEGTQNIIAELTSKTKGKDLSWDETLGQSAAGFAGGTSFGSISGYKDATQNKREAKQAQRGLDAYNLGELQKASDEYAVGVKDYDKIYQELLNKYEGPELDAKIKELIPVEDVIPNRVDFTRLPKTKLQALKTGTTDFLLSRSTDAIERQRENTKTGEAYYRLNRILRGFAPAESGTGEFQSELSFNALKNLNISEFVVPFADIRDKWESSYPLVGKMGSRVGKNIDKYFGQGMEQKIDPALAAEVRKQLGEEKFKELNNDIAATRKNYDNVYKSLSKTLGKDGLKIGYQKDYLTRGWDREAVEANPERFLETLGESYIDSNGNRQKGVGITDDVIKQDILNAVLNGQDPAILTSEQIRGSDNRTGVDRPSFEKQRDARFSRIPDEFRSKSPMSSINDYLMNTSTRLASAQAFGADKANRLNEDINYLLKNKIIGNKDAQQMWNLYDAVHHTFKRPQDDAGRARQDLMKKVAALATFKYLGMATISSITEPAWIIQRNGIVNTLKAAPTIAVHALAGIKRSLYSGGVGKGATSNFARDLIRLTGFALDPKNTERTEKMFAGDSNRWVNVFFRMPAGLFLTQYTNFVRGWAATAALKRIESEAKALKRMKPARRKRLEAELRENGMTIQDFASIYRAGGNKIDIINEDFLNTIITKSDGTQTRVRDLMLPWMRKMVTDVALEPLATNRPLWMSNPDYQLFSQLKSFPILFGNTIAKRAIRKLNPKSCTPDLMGQMSTLAAIGTAIGAAALAMAIKDAIRGSDYERGPLDLVGAIGVPLVGETSLSAYMGGPVVGTLDDFIASLYGEGLAGTAAKGPEEFYDLILRATVGALGAEAVGDD